MVITTMPPQVLSADEGIVIRTDSRLDNMVKHLGYRSVSPSSGDKLSGTILTDKELVRMSQERLRGVKVIPGEKLEARSRIHLNLARAITRKVFPYATPPVHAAVIPPASDRVRTAGMYSTTIGEVYIALKMMEHGKTMVDTLVHELAHHRQYRNTGEAEDLTPAHAESMTDIAAEVVKVIASSELDALLGEVIW